MDEIEEKVAFIKSYPGIKPEKMVGEMLLFNLEDDPAESKNLVESFPKIKEKLLKEYSQFLKTLPTTPIKIQTITR